MNLLMKKETEVKKPPKLEIKIDLPVTKSNKPTPKRFKKQTSKFIEKQVEKHS